MKVFEEYIQNSFNGIPETEDLVKIKHDMIVNMEEKYEDLIKSGVSAHEAVGAVIMDFGNVDELLIEMGYKPSHQEEETTAVEFMPLDRIQDYLISSKQYAMLIALGVSFIIFGVAIFLLMDEFFLSFGSESVLPVINIFIFTAAGVAMFIISSSKMADYEDFDGWFMIKKENRQVIEAELESQRQNLTQQIILGIVLLILSPILILVTNYANLSFLNQVSIPIFLTLVSFAVFLIIRSSMTSSAYETILENGKSVSAYYQEGPSITSSDGEGWASKFNQILWIMAPLTFFLWGILGDAWGKAWIIFPIAVGLQSVVLILFNE